VLTDLVWTFLTLASIRGIFADADA
jgi:hypothetical protein